MSVEFWTGVLVGGGGLLSIVMILNMGVVLYLEYKESKAK